MENDWSIRSLQDHKIGTTIILSIQENSKKNLIQVFKKYQSKNTLAFDKTDITVQLSKFGEEILMSRSQAKRITIGLDKFKHVTLDFSGVILAGQGFVDEIFRVYANEHPEITFQHINANPDVEFMINRGLANTY